MECIFDYKKVLQERQGLPKCNIHKAEDLSWVCMEKNCPKRLFCQFCVIQNHNRTHKNFMYVYDFFQEPLASLQKIDLKSDENTDESTETSLNFKDKAQKLVDQRDEELNSLFCQVNIELQNGLNDIKSKFVDEVKNYIKQNTSDFESLENTRQDYMDFAQTYFSDLDINQPEQIKEGIDIILAKYFSDQDVKQKIENTVNALPNIKCKEQYDVKIKDLPLTQVKYRAFIDKNINIGSSLFSLDSEKMCKDVKLLDDQYTLLKNGAGHASSALGNTEMEFGVNTWSVKIEKLEGSYITIGIMPNTKPNYINNFSTDNDGQGWVLCSDNYSYNMTCEKGTANMYLNTIVNLKLDFEKGEFIMEEKDGKFKYYNKSIQGKKFKAYFGWSSGSKHKISVSF